MPFAFLKRNKPVPPNPAAPPVPDPAEALTEGIPWPSSIHDGSERGVPFTALTEEWRLRGQMRIKGRLSDALNRREAIAISDVSWGPPESGAQLDPAPGLKSVDPYDLILVTAGEDSMPPLSDTERAAMKVHKVPYEVALEVPPFRVIGTVYMHPGSEPDRLLERSTEMFLPIVDAVARLGEAQISEEGQDVILINRFYLRGVGQLDKATGGMLEARMAPPTAGPDLEQP